MADPARWPAVFTPAEGAVLQLATALCEPPGTLDAALVALLRAELPEAALAHLLAVAAEAAFNNRLSNAATQLLGPDGPPSPS